MPSSAPAMANVTTSPDRTRGKNVAWRVLALALATAAILSAAYFPIDQGWVAWFGMVPGLVLVRAELRPRTRYGIAWLAALAFFIGALRWMRVAHEQMFYSWLALSLFCSLFAPVAIWLIRLLDRRGWPLSLSVAVVWTAIEFLRTHLFGGFPWYFLGHSQHGFLAIIQIADLVGVPGVTFLVAAVNGLIAEWLYSRPQVAQALPIAVRPARLGLQLAGVAVLFVATLGYGLWRLNQGPFAEGPVVAVLQTDLEQDVRNSRIDEPGAPSRSVQDIRAQMLELVRAVRRLPKKPDLVIWPETTCESDFKVEQPPPPDDKLYAEWIADNSYRREYFQNLVTACGTHVLLGMNVQDYVSDGRVRKYNSAVLMNPTAAVLGRYDKTHLVPFGEYVPLYETFPFLSVFAPYAGDAVSMLSAGERFPRIAFTSDGKPYSFGCMICYEDSYAHLARKYVTGSERPVDFLVNQSNDGWFRCTQEHEQHLAVCRFRAIETRRAVVRAVNMGISAVIDGNGRVVTLPGPTWEKSKGVMTMMTAPVPLDSRTSLYARTGDWLPWLFWASIAAGIVFGRKERVA